MPLFDAHNHLQDLFTGDEHRDLETDLASAGIAGAAVNGTGEGDWGHVSRVSLRLPWVSPQFGVHPWHVGNRSPRWREALVEKLAGGAGVGEIGLDRWILERARPDDPRLRGLRRAPMEEQVEVFMEQWSLAVDLGRPVSVHCLDAWGDLAPLLLTAKAPARGFLLHAFSGPESQIGPLADRGAYFSFNGAFLADPASARAQAFRRMPIDRILVETDAPAFPMPESLRRYRLPEGPAGQARNHPSNLQVGYEGLSAILGIALPDLTDQVAKTFRALFGTR